jgi:hypothetical protein
MADCRVITNQPFLKPTWVRHALHAQQQVVDVEELAQVRHWAFKCGPPL